MIITEHTDERGDFLRIESDVTFLIDPLDLSLIEGKRWFLIKGRSEWNRYVARSNGRGIALVHRDIMAPAPALTVDHRDGDGMNNRRYNMRICTRAQNLMNRHNYRKSPSGYRGVYASGKRWIAMLSVGTPDDKDRKRYLGVFDTREEAARKWDAEAFALRGEYAQLNFPLGTDK